MGQDWMGTLKEIKKKLNNLPDEIIDFQMILIYCSLASLNIVLLLMVLWGSDTSGYIN